MLNGCASRANWQLQLRLVSAKAVSPGTTYVLCREVGLPLRVPVPVLHSHCVLTGEARTPALIVLGFDVDRTRSERRLPLLPRTLSDDLDFVLSLWSIALVRIVASWPVLTMVVDA